LKLIFDKDAIINSINLAGYDSQMLPMGKLEDETIKQGYKILQEIEDLV
jgi:hypothetical protein